MSKADIGARLAHVRFTPKADIGTQSRNVRFVPEADSCTAAISILFDYPVGGDQHTLRERDAERFRSLKIDR